MGVAWGTEEAIAKADVVHVEIDVLQCNSVAVQNLAVYDLAICKKPFNLWRRS